MVTENRAFGNNRIFLRQVYRFRRGNSPFPPGYALVFSSTFNFTRATTALSARLPAWTFYLLTLLQGRSQGGKGGKFPPPPNRKNCCRKMVLFPKALFLVTNIRKKIKNKNKKFNFSIEFSSKNFKIFSKFPNNLCFSSKRAKNERIVC